MERLYIRMLGEFSLRYGENDISDSGNRAKKVWQLLAYLICQKERSVPRQELIQLLWGDDSSSSNPENTLKITFHRARTLLDQLWPTAGHDLILRQEGGYKWNSEIPTEIDIEQFEHLSHQEGDAEERLDAMLSALTLYHGDFLSKLSAEPWVIPISTHFHNLYIQTILAVCPLLSARGRHEEAVDICRRAITLEPYHEPLHQQLIRSLLDLGDQKGAIAVYDALSQRLFNDFGIKPNADTRALHRAATQTLSTQTLPMDVVLEQVKESDSPSGALECEYDFFKILCFSEARAMLRSGKVAHISLLSLTGKDGEALPKRSLDRTMDNLQEHIRTSLRRGDAFTRCSASQFILLLPQANYENSLMVTNRVVAGFHRKYPHTPAKILSMVQPLSPEGLQD
ncbi:MAG: BTAD domain-containing putative transcriptional regulator [Bacillota bacterium]|nr:BTAD domain-containing putative transcriptional regulator [Bacillota bacterium]